MALVFLDFITFLRKLARVFRLLFVLILVLVLSLPLRHDRATVSNQTTSNTISFSNFHPCVEVVSSNIEKPELDKRDYRFIRLNKLEVLLISDNKTEYSSAAMSVHAGSMNDPKHFQGLAHVCEHYVLLGIKLLQMHQVNLQEQKSILEPMSIVNTLELMTGGPTLGRVISCL